MKLPRVPAAVLLRGSEMPPPARRALRAGPLSMVLEDVGLRYIRLGEREVVRGIYCAVRDQNWGTVPPRVKRLEVESGVDSFRAGFEVENRQGDIDFAWRGSITGEASGRIVFSMEGEARSSFLRNRIGFCILHPMRECAGAPCRVRRADGGVIEGSFPRAIAPRAPFDEIVAFAHQAAPSVWAELELSGDIFEMEDQRNWTDASFKTFCTPLRIPFPVEIRAGDRVAQSVTLTLRSPAPIVVSDRRSQGAAFEVSTRAAGRLPALGLQTASHGAPLSPCEVERLRRLRLSHLRWDLRLDEDGLEARLRRAAAEAELLEAPLELALFVADRPESELAALAALLERIRPEIRRVLVFHRSELATSMRWVELARRLLGRAAAGGAIGSGTNANFAELNGCRPDPALVDFVCWGMHPQEHAHDDASLVETLEAQAATVDSARAFSGRQPLVVSPVTLRRRFNPYATAPEPAPAPGELPPEVDARQMSLFGACWTLGSVKHLAESGAASATYFETSGWRGVLETEAGAPLSEEFRSIPGAVFPLYHVLADLGDFRGAELLPSRSSEPLLVDGLALRLDGATCVLIANMSPESRVAAVTPFGASARVRRLDGTSAIEAMVSPEDFRRREGELARPDGSSLRLELAPHAVLRIDWR
jgi:hypothetical protein